MQQEEKVIIIGGGPCGMSAAIELKKKGINPLIIEKGNIVNSIYHYPTHQTFFSSSEKLEIGKIPFISERQKPVRNEALSYYRAVAGREELRLNTYEKVTSVEKGESYFTLHTEKNEGGEKAYKAEQIVVATGYYDQPNYMNVKGESLPKVMHYFKEGHPYYKKDVVIIGGKNSAADAALELEKCGANITVLYRGEEYSKSIKPWILPQFEALVRKGIIEMEFCANVKEITENKVIYECKGEEKSIPNDFVFAMTGYRPDHTFLTNMGVELDEETGRPAFNEDTMETNINGIYIAGVIAAGYNNNEIFIENGRYHGEKIASSIAKQ
ncbi:Thioredoxin reductase [Halobacillus karajensis]|uniref:Thioredoxin reductase n=2 Tax=Halobacillus karajensis TaxID=195088 RepID=A0A024P2W8_9BACI|nr:YpdA family putative bacillithiol disulfide reductase [Halobacillus karajensis]CDQ19475.1 Thioredoxin reductase [Halobacillus karajensis]CDQ21937.1 Thioredoxin reductase [Halobacillus karajensis]CDQ27778.1 Thioredoxin reductase [Halobacillus karajensis]